MELGLEKIVKVTLPIIMGAYVVYRVYENQTKKEYIDLNKVRGAGL